MKAIVPLVLAGVIFSPAAAFAGAATDAALGLGAFAVFNQMISGVGVFGGRPAVVVPPAPVYYPPPPVYVAPPAVYVAPPAVYVAPRPVYYAPGPVIVHHARVKHGHWKHISKHHGHGKHNGHGKHHGHGR